MDNTMTALGYNEEVQKIADEYLEKYEEEGAAMPSISGLAVKLGVTRQTLYNWSEQFETFGAYHDRLMATQENVLWDKGLRNEYNAALVKLALGNHGHKEKIEESGDPNAPKELNIRVINE